MALDRDIYRAFEDIVGEDNISDDPAVLDCYRYPLTHTAIHLGPYYGVSTPRGAAVLLPGSTEEVQAIVRACNRFKLKVKASSTFWSAQGYPTEEGAIQLDMRRMDKILEIDEKNMYAVVEPHVIGATLQAEAMKVGLNVQIHGSGASCSPLASGTSFAGFGPDTLYFSSHGDNMIGAEWVMPDGEIVRTGSMSQDCGWYYGEGPGPSVRAILRGYMGASGAMGVFTKYATKLYPWPGPTTLPVRGLPPAYKTDLPDNIRGYTLGFPDWQSWSDSAYHIFNSGIGYVAHRQYNMFGRDLKGATLRILTDPDGTLNDLETLLEDPAVKKFNDSMCYDYQLILAGMTERDMAWQEACLDKILAETGGWKVEELLEKDLHDWSLLYMLRLGHKNLNLAFGGGYDGCFGHTANPDFGIKYIDRITEFKLEWEKKGAIVAAGGDSTMGGIGGLGGGGNMMWENFTHFDPHDKFSSEGTLEFFNATSEYGKSLGLGPGLEKLTDYARWTDGKSTPKDIRDKLLSGAAQPQANRYQQRVKDTFDPNNIGDSYYRTLK